MTHTTTLSACVIGSLVFLSPVAAVAQDVEAQGPSVSRSDRLAVTNGGPISRPTANDADESEIGTSFQISSIDDTVAGEFALTLGTGDVDYERTSADKGTVSFSRTDISLKATIPFNANNGDNPFINFTNIGNDAQVTLDLVHRSGKDITGRQRYDYLARFVGQCLVEVSQEWLDNRRPIASLADQDAVATIKRIFRAELADIQTNRRLAGTNDLSEHVDSQLGDNENAFWADSKNACRITADGPIRNQGDLIDRYAQGALSKQEFASFYTSKSIRLFGVSASSGFEEFELLDRPGFQLDSVDRVGFELEGYAGIISGSGNVSGRLSAAFVRSFEAQDDVEFCRSTSPTDQECLTGPDMLPVRSDSLVLKGEARLVLLRDRIGRPQLAMAPEVSYNVDDNEWLFDTPIYFQRSDDGGLDAGLRLLYGTKDDDFSVGLFIGVPFTGLFLN
ncbi:hypothetical protein [uncultured Erythrobacter sp.]|uniref:hypothetical protein n=1 Tax=uncultured Erythrobacter sp. TaxID=263913 RepID=UPI002636F8CE|nr:hypothetical protein [uncultured Erythrobacter sp.]